MNSDETIRELLSLSRFLGEEHRNLAILGEGNTSAKIDDETFVVEASGSCLLTLPEINFIGHTHSIPVNQVLCSPLAAQFATSKLFPDEIVCCGAQSVFVSYTDPGLRLSQTIRNETQAFKNRFGGPPRIILLANHGLIAALEKVSQEEIYAETGIG